MRVTYVLQAYPVPSQTFVHAELVALRAAGHDVTVVAHAAGDPTIRFGEGPEGAPFPLAHVGLEPSLALDAVLRAADHLHGHFADHGLFILAGLAARADRSFSFTAHAYDLFRQGACVPLDAWAALPAGLRRIVTISRFHRDWLAVRGVPAARIAVIPNGAHLAPLLAAGPPPPTHLRRVVAVGRPVAKKGFGTLVQAWDLARRSLPHLELTIVGGAGLVNAPPPTLRLLPMLPYADTLREMAAADLVVAPSLAAPDGDMDGIPTVLAEAGALRRPVVASRITGTPDLVMDGVNGLLVPPGDVRALASSFVRLARRPVELARMGAAGPTLASAHDARLVARKLAQEAFGA
jgi:glycosyltransferase involved in cell wall biosynthesis